MKFYIGLFWKICLGNSSSLESDKKHEFIARRIVFIIVNIRLNSASNEICFRQNFRENYEKIILINNLGIVLICNIIRKTMIKPDRPQLEYNTKMRRCTFHVE